MTVQGAPMISVVETDGAECGAEDFSREAGLHTTNANGPSAAVSARINIFR
jgi:hypothetical protein